MGRPLTAAALAALALALAGCDEERPSPHWSAEETGRLLAAAEEALSAEHIRSPRPEHDPYQPLILRLDLLRGEHDPVHLAAPMPERLDAFHGSLACAGRAALLAASDPEAAEAWFRRALARAAKITHWTGKHATSHGLLFHVVPLFPADRARALAGACREALVAWTSDAHAAHDPLRELAKLTVRVAPEEVHDLLLEVALRSHHYFDAIEVLGEAFAREDFEHALREAQAIYDRAEDAPVKASRTCASCYLRSVRFVQAETDLKAAMSGLVRMRGHDPEAALLGLAERLIDRGRKVEAAAVLNTVKSLDSKFDPTIERLARQRAELAGDAPAAPDRTFGPEDFDDLFAHPESARVHRLGGSGRLVFRDPEQALAFVARSPDLAALAVPGCMQIAGAARAAVHGRAMLAATALGDVDAVLACAARIEAPELRAHFLLEAAEEGSDLPAVLREWPIRFWPRVEVVVGD